MKRPELEKTLKELGYDEAQMADILKAVEDELEPETKPKPKKKKDDDDDDEEIEKYKKENDVLKKALEIARLGQKTTPDDKYSKLEERFEKAISTVEILTESVEELKDINKSLESRIEELGSQPMGIRAMKMSSVIEKSVSGEEILGEDKRLTLSVSKDRQLIEKAIGDIIEQVPEGVLRTSYEDSLMKLNAAGVAPTPDVAQDLFKRGIRLTK